MKATTEQQKIEECQILNAMHNPQGFVQITQTSGRILLPWEPDNTPGDMKRRNLLGAEVIYGIPEDQTEYFDKVFLEDGYTFL